MAKNSNNLERKSEEFISKKRLDFAMANSPLIIITTEIPAEQAPPGGQIYTDGKGIPNKVLIFEPSPYNPEQEIPVFYSIKVKESITAFHWRDLSKEYSKIISEKDSLREKGRRRPPKIDIDLSCLKHFLQKVYLTESAKRVLSKYESRKIANKITGLEKIKGNINVPIRFYRASEISRQEDREKLRWIVRKYSGTPHDAITREENNWKTQDERIKKIEGDLKQRGKDISHYRYLTELEIPRRIRGSYGSLRSHNEYDLELAQRYLRNMEKEKKDSLRELQKLNEKKMRDEKDLTSFLCDKRKMENFVESNTKELLRFVHFFPE